MATSQVENGLTVRLRGNVIQTLDDKNRSPLSAEFHETFRVLSEKFPASEPEKASGLSVVVSKSIHGRLAIYPVGIYERIYRALERKADDPLAKRLSVDLDAFYSKSSLDGQRRFKLPSVYANLFLREYTVEQLQEAKDTDGDEKKSKGDDEEQERKGTKACKIGLMGLKTYVELLTVPDFHMVAKRGMPASEYDALIASDADLRLLL